MGLYFESLTTDLIVLFVALDVLILLIYWNAFQFWKRKGVPYLKPSFPFGNMSGFMTGRLNVGENHKENYFKLKEQGLKYGGYFALLNPVFMPIDTELVKQIMIKDFKCFQNRGFYSNVKDDPLSAHLFVIDIPAWRKLRIKLTPTFTSARMKEMFHTLKACGEYLDEHLILNIGKGEPLDIKDIAARFTTDIISLCAFGLENCSLKDPDNEFRKYGKMIFDRNYLEKIKQFCSNMAPYICEKYLHLTINRKEVSEFFLGTIKETVEYREKNHVQRNDMLNLLIKLKNNKALDDSNAVVNGKQEDSLTFEELAAQCFIFFIAGYETSSSTMTFALFELCQHQDIQDKVREEILQTLRKYNGELTYDAVQEMTYMQQVIKGKYTKSNFISLGTNICSF